MDARRSRAILLAVATLLGALGVCLAGCSSKAAHARQQKARVLAGTFAKPTVASVGKAAERFSKPAPRDPALGKFADLDYGILFRYPRNFALLESEEDEDEDADRAISWQQAREAGAGVRTQDELGEDDAGAVLVATVVVPDDAYPNTSFAGGSLQFAVNRYQTAGTCRASLLARMGDAKGASGTVSAQSVAFAWIDRNVGDGSTEFYERDYAGFANGSCYEFFVRVGVAGNVGATTTARAGLGDGTSDTNANGLSERNGEESSGVRAPNEKKILGQMDKIVASLQVEQRAVSVLDKAKYKQAAGAPNWTQGLQE
jgi:hypothetical protein